MALAAGVDLRTVQEMLGHSSFVLTADTYTSVLPDVARVAAEKVAALIIRAGTPTQIRVLADLIDPRYRAMVWLGAGCGLRWSEAASLTT